MFLELAGLRKSYGRTVAVDGFDLEAAQGECVCILGPSGCGKTTAIGMVGGFVSPDAGRIRLDGQDVTRQPPNVRPTCTVFQNYALFPHMTVQKNVVYGLKFRGASRAQAARAGRDMLEMMGLAGLGERRVGDLSGGEQQRVALARALILEPKVLLLDEPLSNLDARLRVGLRREIKDVQTRLGVTMLYVTHDQDEALALADRLAVMNAGRIEQTGPPEEVYARPASLFVAGFLGRANLIPGPDGLMLVRPEDMFFCDAPGRRQGTVLARLFGGPVTTYLVEAGLTRPLEVDVLGGDSPRLAAGENVAVDWRRERRMRGEAAPCGRD
jgi:iron(III) transport system ATP-binding protein